MWKPCASRRVGYLRVCGVGACSLCPGARGQACGGQRGRDSEQPQLCPAWLAAPTADVVSLLLPDAPSPCSLQLRRDPLTSLHADVLGEAVNLTATTHPNAAPLERGENSSPRSASRRELAFTSSSTRAGAAPPHPSVQHLHCFGAASRKLRSRSAAPGCHQQRSYWAHSHPHRDPVMANQG